MPPRSCSFLKWVGCVNYWEGLQGSGAWRSPITSSRIFVVHSCSLAWAFLPPYHTLTCTYWRLASGPPRSFWPGFGFATLNWGHLNGFGGGLPTVKPFAANSLLPLRYKKIG